MTDCSRCGVDPSKSSLRLMGNREQTCGESPGDALQPMWACRFGVAAYDEYHATHEHADDGTCVLHADKEDQ